MYRTLSALPLLECPYLLLVLLPFEVLLLFSFLTSFTSYLLATYCMYCIFFFVLLLVNAPCSVPVRN